MGDWLASIKESVDADGVVVRVAIVAASGPTPREVGAWMLVAPGSRRGKIGRVEFEQSMIAHARELMAARVSSPRPSWQRELRAVPLGEVLGASSGGGLGVLFEVFARAECDMLAAAGWSAASIALRPVIGGVPIRLVGDGALPHDLPVAAAAALHSLQRAPFATTLALSPDEESPDGAWLAERVAPALPAFYVYGTGLLGRALIATLDGLPFDPTWLDTDAARLTGTPSPAARTVATTDLVAAALAAPAGALHAVMTASHEQDYAIVRALLSSSRPRFVGVIGSALKRERMLERLALDGLPAAARARLVCPIGLPGIRAKSPRAIAVAVAAQALVLVQAPANDQ